MVEENQRETTPERDTQLVKENSTSSLARSATKRPSLFTADENILTTIVQKEAVPMDQAMTRVQVEGLCKALMKQFFADNAKPIEKKLSSIHSFINMEQHTQGGKQNVDDVIKQEAHHSQARAVQQA